MPTAAMKWTRGLSEVSRKDLPQVSGENAALGERLPARAARGYRLGGCQPELVRRCFASLSTAHGSEE